MACYLGSRMLISLRSVRVWIGGEVVTKPGDVRPALDRAIKATRDGKPYIVDVVIERTGIGSESSWYPPYSSAQQRTRKV